MQTSTISILPLPGALPTHQRALADAAGSVGVLLPSLSARIIAENGSYAAPGELGELFVRGESVALGYWCNPAASAQVFLEGGWLSTGDLFRADEHGNLLYVARSVPR